MGLVMVVSSSGGGGEEPTLAETTMQSSVTQYGITWTFDTDYAVGQFVNDDYFVVENSAGSGVNVIDIDPESVDSSGRYINGSVVNQDGGVSVSGLDSAYSDRYSHTLNAAYGVSAGSPLSLAADESLLSCISRVPNDGDDIITDAAVLTVLSETPDATAFRPSYCGPTKTLYLMSSVTQAKKDSLSALSTVGTAPAWSESETNVARPWIDFAPSWSRRQVHGMPYTANYGRETSQHTGAVMLMLLRSGVPYSTKETTLIGFIQRGIDLYGAWKDAYDNGRDNPYYANGAHSAGRLLAILFAGYMLGDSDIMNASVLANAVGGANDKFHENNQTEHVPSARVTMTHNGFSQGMYDDMVAENNSAWTQFQSDYPTIAALAGSGTWNADHRSSYYQPYEPEQVGMPEWHARAGDSNEGNASFSRIYRTVSADTWHGQALAALVLGLDTNWDQDAYFDYVHRHMTIARTGTDPFRTLIGYESLSIYGESTFDTTWDRYWPAPGVSAPANSMSEWVDAMWDEHWDTYYSYGG